MRTPINFRYNYPSLEEEINPVRTLFSDAGNGGAESILSLPPIKGPEALIEAAHSWLGLKGNKNIKPENIVACGSANQALFCILSFLKRKSESIITDEYTYSSFKAMAQYQGFKFISGEFEDAGFDAHEFEQLIQWHPSKILYLQPTIQNPTCAVMSLEQREVIAAVAEKYSLLIIEDDAYRFLHPNPPPRFLDLVPEHTISITSLSKPFNSLVKTAFVVLPETFVDKMSEMVRFTSSGNSTLLSQLAYSLITGSELDAVIKKKREKAVEVQALVARKTEGLTYKSFPSSFHIWLKLPKNVHSSVLVKQAEAQNILITGCEDFSINEKCREDHLRICFGGESDLNQIEAGLDTLISLIRH